MLVYCGCETTSRCKEECARGLRVFENKVLMRIFGPKLGEMAVVAELK
jgi:hypothetical protein